MDDNIGNGPWPVTRRQTHTSDNWDPPNGGEGGLNRHLGCFMSDYLCFQVTVYNDCSLPSGRHALTTQAWPRTIWSILNAGFPRVHVSMTDLYRDGATDATRCYPPPPFQPTSHATCQLWCELYVTAFLEVHESILHGYVYDLWDVLWYRHIRPPNFGRLIFLIS